MPTGQSTKRTEARRTGASALSPVRTATFANAILALHVGVVAFFVPRRVAILAGGPLAWRLFRYRTFRIT